MSKFQISVNFNNFHLIITSNIGFKTFMKFELNALQNHIVF